MNRRLHRLLLPALLAIVPVLSLAAAETLPAGTEFQVRLKTKVSSYSKADDKVEAVLISPVVSGQRILVPTGSLLAGRVLSAAAAAKADERAILKLGFSELTIPGGEKTAIEASVLEVDNARETVDKQGQILGILESETLTARMDKGLDKLSGRFAKFAEILQAAKGAVLQQADTSISYEPGVEMTLASAKPLEIAKAPAPPDIGSVFPEQDLYGLVNSLPFRTNAQNPPKPSDLTNLLFVGARDKVEAAFGEAGWSTAEQVNAKSGLETFRAIVENRGYSEAPMSILLLDGKAPAMVFQKQNNTFAERHHLRIFQRPERFGGKEVWACAATHDIGISFSPENRTFIHDIDGQIDRERAKVVSDLLYTGLVKGLALVERPEVPTSGENATGDKIRTDGKMAVLLLQ